MTEHTFKVWSLDVWGHSHKDCAKHGCTRCAEDENRCNCGYDVNDRSNAGRLTVWSDSATDPTDAEYVAALVMAGFLTRGAEVEIDFDGEEYVNVDAKDDGRPLLTLERVA